MDFKKYVAEGVQDYLPLECYNKREVEQTLRKRFLTCGYREVETPMFEYYGVFGDGIGSIREEKMIKFFDEKGRILTLRPDITMPIARIAATKLSDFPQRLCYIGNAFGFDNSVYGEQKEFRQAGVECIGIRGEEMDAEMIPMAINAMLDVGLETFQLDLGQVEFFKGLMEEAGLGRQESEELLVCIDRKDMLEMELLLKDKPLSEKIKTQIMQLTTLYGGEEVLEQAYAFSQNKRCRAAVAHLQKVYDILCQLGLGTYVSFDFGMIKSIDYYTGILFRGITDDLGCPVFSGGRYDTLIGSFGKEKCAIGFAIGIKRVLIALERQGNLKSLPLLDAVVGGDDIAFVSRYCEEARKDGARMEIVHTPLESALLEYAKGRAKKAIYIVNGDVRIMEVSQ